MKDTRDKLIEKYEEIFILYKQIMKLNSWKFKSHRQFTDAKNTIKFEIVQLESDIASLKGEIEEKEDDKILLIEPDKIEFKAALTGWICPRCQTVHGPFTTSCGCPPPTWTGSSTTTVNDL